jgi:hypothetical protein
MTARSWSRVAGGVLVLLSGLLFACAPRDSASAAQPELWFYYGVNLTDASAMPELVRVWTRAARAGYRRVVLADPKLARLGHDQGLGAAVAQVRAVADSLGLAVIPIAFQVGRSDLMLAGAPDLVEALPVRDAPFLVKGGVAVPEAEPWLVVPPEPAQRDPGLDWRDGIGTLTDPAGRVRGRFDVRVAPQRAYRIVARVRTEGYDGRLAIHVLDGERDRSMAKSLRLEKTQDWTELSVPFNSLESSRVQVWFGTWDRGRGTARFSAFRIEPAGPVNVVRRPSTPFGLRHAETGAALVEGRDYDVVRDPLLGRSPRPGSFDAWHEPPAIHTHLADGTRLLASWHQAAVVYGKQVTCCVSEPAVRERLRAEAVELTRAFGRGRVLMMFDEIRALNRDPSCLAKKKDAGAVLAEAARVCASYLPGDTLYVWNDMFDPFQNAVRDYALVRGDLAGSWEGLDRAVRVVDWNGAHRDASLRFFERKGHGLVIAGYYDGPVDAVADWMKSAEGVSGVEAVMYTTWLDHYDDLEAFARAVRR